MYIVIFELARSSGSPTCHSSLVTMLAVGEGIVPLARCARVGGGRRAALSGGDVPSPDPWRNLPVNGYSLYLVDVVAQLGIAELDVGQVRFTRMAGTG